MCTVPQGVTLSCQLSFYPLGQADYLPPIQAALDIIEEAGLAHQVGEMSTVVQGEAGAVFALLERIARRLDAQGCGFAMTTTISNTCGVQWEGPCAQEI